jgi:hypothetical protein
LRLKKGSPFDLIERYRLFSNIRDKVLLLFQFDATKAIDMLINHIPEVPVATGNLYVLLSLSLFLFFLSFFLFSFFSFFSLAETL